MNYLLTKHVKIYLKIISNSESISKPRMPWISYTLRLNLEWCTNNAVQQFLLLKLCEKKKSCTALAFFLSSTRRKATNRSIQQCLSAHIKGRRMAAMICKASKGHNLYSTKRQYQLVEQSILLLATLVYNSTNQNTLIIFSLICA